MNDRTGDFVTVLADERTWHSVSDSPEPEFRQARRGWHGDVFFDHVRGVIEPHPAALVDGNAYLLVAAYRDFDWTAQHATDVKEFATAAELIAEASAMVARERNTGTSNIELWEVYGVRIRERRPRTRRARQIDGVDARLVEDIRNAPADDGPRLVWADAVGGERGELVVIQLDLARGTLAPDEALARKRRQRELLARHGEQWSGLAGIATRVAFHRGFVDAADLGGELFLEHADDISEAAPCLSSLTVTGLHADGPAGDPVPLLSKLCADPAVRELQGLDLGLATAADIDGRTPGDVVVEIVARSHVYEHLRAFGLHDRLTMLGARSVIELAPALERLCLRSVDDDAAIHRLLTAGRLQQLRSFELDGLAMGPFAAELPHGVTVLGVRDLGRESVAALAPVAGRIEHLDAGSGELDLAPYVAFPRLRTLAIGQPLVRLEPEPTARARLRAQHVPALRELSIRGAISEQHVRILVEELGPQLELLDLRNSPAALRFVNELKPRVRGELLVGNRVPARRLLRTAPTTQLPWWDHVTLA